MSELINENRFFSEVLPHIGDKNKIVEELVENSLRAKSKKCDLFLSGKTIKCVNDGNVLEDFSSLLVVADTNYDEEVIKSYKPAGMGIMMMMSVAEAITFSSGNRMLSVDCEKFWVSSVYRMEVIEQIKSDNLNSEHEYVDGFITEIVCKSVDFVNALNKLYRFFSDSDSCYIPDFAYYNMNISFNERPVRKDEHKWVLSKNGGEVFENAHVGVNYELFDGCVYWFGKKIQCPEISPFKIVIDEPVDFISPSLPDRLTISATKDQLKRLKLSLEDYLADDIQRLVSKCDANTQIGGAYNTCYQLLAHLERSYDIEHFQWWILKNTYLSMRGYRKISRVDVFYDVNTELFVNGDECEVDFGNLDIPCVDGEIYYVSLSVGNTPAPQSVLSKYAKRLDVEYDRKESMDGYTDSGECCIVPEICVNGFECHFFVDNDNCIDYFTPNVNIDSLSCYLSSVCEDSSSDSMERSIRDVLTDWRGELKLSGLVNNITGLLLKTSSQGLASFNLNYDASKPDAFSINVVSKDGNKHSFPCVF